VPLVVKPNRRLLQLAATLDVDLIRAVDQDVGNGVIGEQLFQRTEPEDLVLNLFDDALARGVVVR